MKKNVLNNIEEIKKERNISKEVKKTILEIVIANWAIAISFIILIIAFMFSANFLSKDKAIFVYNCSAMIFLVFSIVIIEIAYKKDSGTLALMAIELLVISVFTLFSPHIFIRANYNLIYGFIVLVSIYYIIKIIRIYFLEKKQYLNDISDITDIIKKESKDDLAKQEQQKREKERKLRIEEQKKESTKKAKANSKKTKTNNNIKKEKTSAKKQTKTTTKKKIMKEEQDNTNSKKETSAGKETKKATNNKTMGETKKKTGKATEKSKTTRKNTAKKTTTSKTKTSNKEKE